jgi:hypothetical protein
VHLVGSYVEVLCKRSFTAYDLGCPPENLAMDAVARHEGLNLPEGKVCR